MPEYNSIISDFFPVIYKDRSMLNDKRKICLILLIWSEFSFLLDVYKMRPGFQL